MSLAIKVRETDGTWFLLVDGIHARAGVVDSWIEMARDLYPGSEIRVIEEVSSPPQPEDPTRH
jgi:hypothetical protein